MTSATGPEPGHPWPRLALPHAVLGLFALGMVAWDLWVLVNDRRPTLGSDSFTMAAAGACRDLTPHSLLALFLSVKGPLVPLMSVPFILVVGPLPLATRLLCSVAHGLLILQAFALTRRMTGRPTAGLWAALIIGTFPMTVGWARLDFHDPILANMVLLVLHVMFVTRLDRGLPSLKLGLLVGASTLVKLASPVFLAGPCLWLLVTRVRGAATWRNLGILAVGAMAVASLWMVPNLSFVLRNFRESTGLGTETAWDKARLYLSLPGSGPLLALALLALALLMRRDGWRDRRWTLLASALLPPLAAFVLVFDYSARYVLPLFPVAATALGVGIDRLVEGVPGGRRRWAATAVALVLIGGFLWCNLGGLPSPRDREASTGILVPDRRPYGAMGRVLTRLKSMGEEVLVLASDDRAAEMTAALVALWRYRGIDLKPIPLAVACQRLAQGRRLPVLRAVTGHFAGDGLPLASPGLHTVPMRHVFYGRLALSWLKTHHCKALGSSTDTFNIIDTGYLCVGARAPRPGAVPTCVHE